MINVFNRALLIADINCSAIIKAKEQLERAGIEYYENKKIFSRSILHFKFIQRSANLPVPEPKNKKFLYLLYVKRSELKKAREVTGLF